MILQTAAQAQAAPAATTRIGEPNAVAMVFFFAFISITLAITYWAARRTRTTEEFYAAGRTIMRPATGAVNAVAIRLVHRFREAYE